MSISLEAFIASKPKELRLGQWFILCYCKPINGHWEYHLDKLWNSNGVRAEVIITELMIQWQWDSLPDIPKEKHDND